MTESPVDLDGFQSIVVITLNRIYDAQMALLALIDPDKAEQLASLHERGVTLSPPASILVD